MDYYLFNKAQDYRRGQMENLKYEDGRLKLLDAESGMPGVFLSRTLDSWEKETAWHRLFMETEIGGNMAVSVHIYAADSATQRLQVELWKSQMESRSLQQTLELMGNLEKYSARSPEDVLLHQVQGRYLWIGLVLWGNGQRGPEISLIQIYFPKESWTKYLPELYQTEDSEFLTRFLAIFQTLYDELEQEVRGSARYLDLQAAPPNALEQLGGWLHVDNSHLWTMEHLRQYLEHGAQTYENRGTAAALERKVEIFTGEKPLIKEGIPGEAPHRFRLFLSEQAVPDQKTYLALGRIVREGKPADMEADIVILRPWLILGQNTYLGVNSYLNRYQEASLDGQGMMGSTMLGGKDI